MTAPDPNPAPVPVVRSLTERLLRAQVAGCTCLTKTPEVACHDPQCTYRLSAEALQRIDDLTELLRRAYRHHTTTSLPLAVARYGSFVACATEGSLLWPKIAAEIAPPASDSPSRPS